MEYSTRGLEKLEITDTYKQALEALMLIEQAQCKLGPRTESFRYLALAAAETRNWCNYLASGGAPIHGPYQKLRWIERATGPRT